MSGMLLTIEGLGVKYGNVAALSGVSLEVGPGEIVALIGANGAGKSTTLRTISGLHAPFSGSISLDGRSLLGRKADHIARLGISHAPEGRRILPGLTVEQNLELGTTVSRKRGVSIKPELDRMYALFPALASRRAQLGWSLSGGEQQMLSLGRALISRPRLLLLDEPSLGLAPKITQDVFRSIAAINKEQGLAILLVEQNAFMALNVAHRGYLLENGRVRQSGTSAELRKSEAIHSAYLGA
jgi:branched-chain amino acid transport system ATP-binding protein